MVGPYKAPPWVDVAFKASRGLEISDELWRKAMGLVLASRRLWASAIGTDYGNIISAGLICWWWSLGNAGEPAPSDIETAANEVV